MVTFGIKEKKRSVELKDELLYILEPLIANKPFEKELRHNFIERLNNLIQISMAEGYLSKKCNCTCIK